ncbi:hypothetical protein [Streptomyces sp. CC53]|uniref:hypothetical protein n=1 Tax=Streptomyces sp. CC53 TaxID=1906740 RepID=UPI0015A5C383|nr:hypothetical protein [Streptomyces sp. CC53]
MNTVNFTDEELLALAEFFKPEGGSMDDAIFDRIGRRLLVVAAKADLIDPEVA